MMKTVLLYSGGLDSTVLLFRLRSEGVKDIHCLSIDYGQRHKKELLISRSICARLKIPHETANLSHLAQFLSGNSQTDSSIPVPEGHYTEESMKLTVVPNRNMLMLSVAMGWALSLKYDSVAYAAHAGDHTIYPDCRPEFVEQMKKVAALCDWQKLDLLTPFLHKTKGEIVALGTSLDVPFSETWSCYQGRELHCGKCGTCVERKEAFKWARVPDPTVYEKS